VHPQPNQLESLSSWLERLARLYGMSVQELLTHNLGWANQAQVSAWIDYDPPEDLLAALNQRTGVPVTRLRDLTLAGWSPWLFDSHHAPRPGSRQEAFDTYIRANSVLLAPGEAGTHDVEYPRGWSGPWRGAHAHRACPVCAADPDRGTALVWQMPLVIGCGEHGVWLENNRELQVLLALDRPITPTLVAEPVATLDRYTYTALTTGRVDLPGRSVHAAVWFRLLRSLLDEVSLAPSTMRAATRSMLQRIWAAAGVPERAGLLGWRPYELLKWDAQQAMLTAAATALRLVADGEIVPRGRLGSALAPGSRQRTFDGDRSSPWQEALDLLAGILEEAREDRDTAHRLLRLITRNRRTLAEFEDARACLFGAGVPGEFLPTASDLGRTDLG
jgi:hypothetical protein